jgi:hypothetical protein
MQTSLDELKALWKQRFGTTVPKAYTSKSAVVEAYLLGKPASTAARPANPPQLRNAEWTVTRGGKYTNAERVNLPRPELIVNDIRRRLSDAGDNTLNILGGRWSTNEMSLSANFIIIFGGRPDPAEVMRFADVLSAPFGIGSYLVPKAGFSRIRLFNVPVFSEHDSTEDLYQELIRNPGLADLKFIDKPRWMFGPDRRRPHADQVIFTIFDPRNTDTPKVLKPMPYMFGVRCRAARFDSRPMLRQCNRCHRLGHSTERCPRPASFIRCRLCGSNHKSTDHDEQCRTKASHRARSRCDCPPKCYNCKDAGKPETGHRAYDHACPLRAMYRLPFTHDEEPETGLTADESGADGSDHRMFSPDVTPAPAAVARARIDDTPLASPAPVAGNSALPHDSL